MKRADLQIGLELLCQPREAARLYGIHYKRVCLHDRYVKPLVVDGRKLYVRAEVEEHADYLRRRGSLQTSDLQKLFGFSDAGIRYMDGELNPTKEGRRRYYTAANVMASAARRGIKLKICEHAQRGAYVCSLCENLIAVRSVSRCRQPKPTVRPRGHKAERVAAAVERVKVTTVNGIDRKKGKLK